VMGVVGGVLGALFAWPLINLGLGSFIEENMGTLFPYFRLEPQMIATGIALAALLASAAAAIPAWTASKLRVVDAVRRIA
jgi:putative ABC transport system permease protein